MPDSVLELEDVANEAMDRTASYSLDHAIIDDLVSVYHGDLPMKYRDLFHEETMIHNINMIRLSWDDLANLAGKEFPLYVRPRTDSAPQREAAEQLEKVGYGYNRAGRTAGGVSMKALMKVLAWWLAGTANAVAMVLPDFKHQSPYFTFRDPRMYFPPLGWTPFSQAAPRDALFTYMLTAAEIISRFPDKEFEIKTAVAQTDIKGKKVEDTPFQVVEYFSEDLWLTGTVDPKRVVLARSAKGDREFPGVNPVVPFSLYTGTVGKGRSMFVDQISIQAALARMFSQKIESFDRSLYPLVFHTPLAEKTIRIGPYATNEFDTSSGIPPRIDVVGPVHQIDADQTLGFSTAMMRILNRNPENLQGAGPADSAKAIDALRGAVTQTIQEGIWPAFIEGLPRLYEAAAKMDVNLWGDVRKKVGGKRKNQPFLINYTPNSLVRGREHEFEIEPGVGLAGYQGTLEILQVYGAELMSDRTAFEQMESIPNAAEEMRRVQAMRSERLSFADLAAKAQAGLLAPGALAEVRNRVQGGEDFFDVIEEMDKAGRLVVQPPAPAMGPMGPEGPGGGGLEQLAGMLPPLGEMRGG